MCNRVTIVRSVHVINMFLYAPSVSMFSPSLTSLASLLSFLNLHHDIKWVLNIVVNSVQNCIAMVNFTITTNHNTKQKQPSTTIQIYGTPGGIFCLQYCVSIILTVINYLLQSQNLCSPSMIEYYLDYSDRYRLSSWISKPMFTIDDWVLSRLF